MITCPGYDIALSDQGGFKFFFLRDLTIFKDFNTMSLEALQSCLIKEDTQMDRDNGFPGFKIKRPDQIWLLQGMGRKYAK